MSKNKQKFAVWLLSSLNSWVWGAVLNQVAVRANDGLMPVAYHMQLWPVAVQTNAHHVTMTAASHLKFLCDYIPYLGYINSPGDAMMDLATISTVLFITTLSILGFRSLK